MSPEHPPRSLRGHAWFLTVVNDVFHDRNAVCMSPESSVSILKSLASLEVPCLLGVSRASSKESRRTCFVPDCSQWCITRQECSMHVTRKLYENLQVISCTFCSYLYGQHSTNLDSPSQEHVSLRGVIHDNGVVPDGHNPSARSPPTT